jgi:hypothetical protein
MKKIINGILKVLLALLLVGPILGTFGIFPEPTPDLYKTTEAYDFIITLMNSGYIMWIMTAVFIICIGLIIKNKMALVSILLLPITLNIIGFHMFMDGGLFTGGAVMGNVLFLINLYFLWQNKDRYKALL